MADEPGATPYKPEELRAALTWPEFPRAAAYDPAWMQANLMGPNAVWLTEALTDALDLKPGLRVLDVGCGKALSSIFLAREFGMEVWATDLWIGATDNLARIREAELEGQIIPIHAEAHALPFAHGFFDAAISVDAYHYFGTADLYFSYFAPFIKPGGQIGIVVPGLREEFVGGVPDHLTPHWEPDFWSFHSPAWWRTHWERTGLATVTTADLVPRGWEHWLRWLEVAARQGRRGSADEAAMMRNDAGRHLGFTRLVARRHG